MRFNFEKKTFVISNFWPIHLILQSFFFSFSFFKQISSVQKILHLTQKTSIRKYVYRIFCSENIFPMMICENLRTKKVLSAINQSNQWPLFKLSPLTQIKNLKKHILEFLIFVHHVASNCRQTSDLH